MSVPPTVSLAERVARQLGLDTARLIGTGPNGSATLNDVLREAGRKPPAAACPSTSRAASRSAKGADVPESRRMEITCDAKAVRETCRALAAVAAEPPDAIRLVVRLSGMALRDFPGLSAEAFVIRTPDEPSARPPASEEWNDRCGGAALTISAQLESIRLGLELGAGSQQEGAAFLDRLRAFCLDPRRALL